MIKSPLNYIGSKTKILNEILPEFPEKIHTFVDLFAGGCNVGINTSAKKVIFNDNLLYLIDMYKYLAKTSIDGILSHIYNQINTFNLSLTNEKGYNDLRKLYNSKKNPLDLLVLVFYSFNHQIRFNNKHEFNCPFGRERSRFNDKIKQNLIDFHTRINQISSSFTCTSFELFDFSSLNKKDFVYCDPPYLISTGSYNDGKRGFKGWTDNEEKALLNLLNVLNEKGVKFALSNVLYHQDETNEILKKWLKENQGYNVKRINFNYSNSNYQKKIRTKNSTLEVLITNYKLKPSKVVQNDLPLENLI